MRNLQNIGRSYIFHTSEGSRDATKTSKNRSEFRSSLHTRSKNTRGRLRRLFGRSRDANLASKTANMAPQFANLKAKTVQLGVRRPSRARPGATRERPERPREGFKCPNPLKTDFSSICSSILVDFLRILDRFFLNFRPPFALCRLLLVAIFR